MGGWNPKEGLQDLMEETLNAMISISEIQKTGKTDWCKLYVDLHVITGELYSWGVHSKEEFKKHVSPPLICWEILQRRDGPEKWLEQSRAQVEIIRKAIHEEYQNLMRILSRYDCDDSELECARVFCMHLNSLAVTDAWDEIVNRRNRLSLA